MKKTCRSNEEKKQLITRLNKISGQINGIKRMIEEDRYCEDILMQLSATREAINSLRMIMLDKHLHSCIKDSMNNIDNEEVIEELMRLFKNK